MSKDQVREAVINEVVRRLRKIREQRGLSMNVLSQRSGLSQAMISLVERDLRTPTLDTLLRMGEVLEVDVGKVISQARKAVASKTK